MSLDKALAASQSEIPECVAAGYVDMATGMLLGVRTVDSHPPEVLDLVAAATGDLFQGRNVVEVENLFKKARGLSPNDGGHYFNEIVVFSTNLIHVFLRSRRYPEHAAVFVTRGSANVGMVLMKARAALPAVEAAV
ncbi:hypothetical protein [Pseudoxanthomonas suwonensis]|uniref:hypothetical protein n=1 Tax=Pseudoxanthomonas suwonensis TaxID=314722 RepID=UPI0004646714|nr:hypothetical protein [Pseudoxanthomonas suwonensis]